MENESQIFTKVDHPIAAPSRPRKLHHMDTEDATNDETDEEDELIRPARPSRKPKKQLRRRSSLHAELGGSDTFDPYEYQDSFPSDSPFFKKSTGNHHYHHNNATATNTLLDPHTNVHSSMSMLSMSTSTNNAITVAPSRKSKVELNVFDTRHHKRHHRRKRSSTPDPAVHHNNHHNNHHHHHHRHHHRQTPQSKEDGLQSLLERLDNRIKNNFGDWASADDDTNFEYRNIGRVPPPHNNTNNESKGALNGTVQQHSHSNNAAVSLPPLYKNYQAVLKSAKGKLMDRTTIALSKDNNDAKSILSEAKRTLTQMGADRVSN